MDFKEATDWLREWGTLEELASELGISVQRIKQARLDASATGYRPAPPGWEEALERIADRRKASIADFKRRLKRS